MFIFNFISVLLEIIFLYISHQIIKQTTKQLYINFVVCLQSIKFISQLFIFSLIKFDLKNIDFKLILILQLIPIFLLIIFYKKFKIIFNYFNKFFVENKEFEFKLCKKNGKAKLTFDRTFFRFIVVYLFNLIIFLILYFLFLKFL